MKRVGDSCRPSGNHPSPAPLSFSLFLLYPLVFFALSSFHLVSHTISGLHPRGFSPLQPDSSISRGSKSCRFYEPPRDGHIYVARAHTETRKRKYVDSAITVTPPTVLYPNGKFPFRAKKPTRSRAARLPTSCMRTLKDATRQSSAHLERI